MATRAQYVFPVVDIFTNGNGSPRPGVVYQDKIFMSARTSGNDFELFTTNGTAAGTSMLKDLDQGTPGSSPMDFTLCNGKLFFQAEVTGYGWELWVTDGTAAGTHLVKDIRPGPIGNGVGLIATGRPSFNVLNDKIYFLADDSTHGRELWVSDGTDAGTRMVKDINPGTADAIPMYMTAFNNKILFSAFQGNANELWITDGTEAGTTMLKDINPGSGASDPANFTVYNGKAYFSAIAAGSGNELWVTDGTEAGTVLVKDIRPGIAGSGVSGFYLFNNRLYFSANNGSAGSELWVTDGTTAGTQMAVDIQPGADGSEPRYFTTYKGKLFFQAKGDTTTGRELWMSDGTATGTQLVKDMVPGPSASNPRSLTVHKGKLYFVFSAAPFNEHLAVSDGTAAGTKKIAPPGANATDPMRSSHEFIVYHDTLYFRAYFDAVIGDELWAVVDTAHVPSGIRSPSPAAFNLYPNPSGGTFTLQWHEAPAAAATLQVFDMAGRKVHDRHIPAGTRSTVLQLGHLPKGTYTLRLQTGDGPPAGERLLIQ